jgi:hypothetical protein
MVSTMKVISMESRLIKLLDRDVSVGDLAEENIAEYVQAKRTVEGYERFVVEPYEAYLKDLGNKQVLSIPGLDVILKERVAKQKRTPKEVLTLLGSFLSTSLENNQNGKQMYGVRRFGKTPAVDARYAYELFMRWDNEVLGTTVSTTVSYKGSLVDRIVEDSSPRLALYAEPRYGGVSMSDVELYLAASEQTARIKERLLKPFEQAFRDQAETSPDKTVFDNRVYGGLAVQVKSVPRREPKYEDAKAMVRDELEECAHLHSADVDGITTFYNSDLLMPRPYASIHALLGFTRDAMSRTDLRQRQEIRILYMPERAVVLAVE